MSKPRLSPGVRVRKENGITFDCEWKAEFITDQFLDNAGIYHERYHCEAHWGRLLRLGFNAAGVDCAGIRSVLDVGSGCGNTALVAARLMPSAHVIASDISPGLLKILLDSASAENLTNLSTWCFDLHQRLFEEQSFDLVIGGSILHHMFDPVVALRNLSLSMRPGSPLLLYEPMEEGAHLMCVVYQALCSELKHEADQRLLHFFQAMIKDYEHRFGVGVVKPWTSHLDDKWLFNRFYLEDLASQVGLSLEVMHGLAGDEGLMISNNVLSTLAASGNGDLEIPPKMLEILREFDEGISGTIKQRAQPERLIVFRK